MVRGYEDGYNDIQKLRKIRIKYFPDAEWYYGVYSDSKDPDSIDAIDLSERTRMRKDNPRRIEKTIAEGS